MWQDQWDDVPVIRQSFVHFPDWSSLWAQHVDNRILFPNLVVDRTGPHGALQHHGGGVRQRSHAVRLDRPVHLVPQTAVTAHAVALLCPVAFLTLTLAQWQNTIWGFQMAWYLVVLALARDDRPHSIGPSLRWAIFVVAIVAAVVGSYSSLQGLLIWPVGLVLLYHRRRSLQAMIVWVIAAGSNDCLVFSQLHEFEGVQSQRNRVESVRSTPSSSSSIALGDIVGQQESKPLRIQWVGDGVRCRHPRAGSPRVAQMGLSPRRVQRSADRNRPDHLWTSLRRPDHAGPPVPLVLRGFGISVRDERRPRARWASISRFSIDRASKQGQ